MVDALGERRMREEVIQFAGAALGAGATVERDLLQASLVTANE
jgi:hypothetical protein